MITQRTLVSASVAFSMVLAVVAFMARDWMWFVIDLAFIIVMVIPSVKDLGYHFRRKMIAMTLLAPVLGILFTILKSIYLTDVSFLELPIYMYLIAAVQSYQCYLIGLMVALILDRSYGLKMTAPWLIIFALGFAMTMSAVDMFFTFGDMYVAGYPVFNEDFYDSDIYTNAILMVAPVAATVVSALCSVLVALRLRGRDKTDLLIPEVDA